MILYIPPHILQHGSMIVGLPWPACLCRIFKSLFTVFAFYEY